MNRIGFGFGAPAAAEPPARPQRTNRLSRSFRQTQTTPAEADCPLSHRAPVTTQETSSCQAEFRTPTRFSRTRPGSSVESPQNDSDLQHDIIWDAASPSPRRVGKRGKRGGAVDISEIVSRIAPQHGRPRVAEPTLQQWIGDSATIPCTPDLQAPRAKRKSPRPSGVDDLLRLARQFDRSMSHCEGAEPNRNQPGHPPPVGGAAEAPLLDLQLDDQLDFLFDGPTHNLSRTPSPPPQDRPAPAHLELLGDPQGGSDPAHLELLGDPQGGSDPAGADRPVWAGAEFEDDWENDDLINDSLVLEMTQNPLGFLAPKLCSTQNPSGSAGRVGSSCSGLGQAGPAQGTDMVGPGPVVLDGMKPRDGKENMTPREVSGLDPNQTFPERNPVDPRGWLTGPGSKDLNPAGTGPERFGPVCLLEAAGTGGRSSTEPWAPGVQSDHCWEDDLEAVFWSDPVWDDPADDDLLCEMCDDLENRIQSSAPKAPNQRAALQELRTTENPSRTAAARNGPARRPAVTAPVQQPIRFLHNRPCQQRAPPTAPSAPPIGRVFNFKKPSNPVAMVASKAKCSAAEIELKKQQAVERRRQRLQAQQNRAGTA